MMSFNDFVHKQNLKKRNMEYKFLSSPLSLFLNDVGIYLRDGPFSSDIEIVKLHPSKGMHWVCYKKEKYFDRYDVVCPKKLSKFNIKRNGYCLYSEYQKQKKLIVFVQVFVYI